MSQDIDTGVYDDLSLAATTQTPWWVWPGGDMSVRVTFAVADAVGTVAVQSYPGNAIGFRDSDENLVESLAVSSALNGLTHEFACPGLPRGRYRVAYTRSSGGAADAIDVHWE